ncbi:MAG: arsenite efflux transporter metallochaperone ArsD [Verrucomicrobiota bacterium]
MKTIQVYDPPMCCSTGVCGTGVDPDLVSFSAMLTQLGQRGIHIERYNLAQTPIAFANNPVVKSSLETAGTEVLPLIFWDGEVKLKGRYPTKIERPDWIREAHAKDEAAS